MVGGGVHPVIYAPPTLVGGVHSLPVRLPRAQHGAHVDGAVPSCSSVPVVEHPRVIQEGSGPLSPQNKPSLRPETGRKRQRNPPQKAPPHKELRNVATPPKVLSNPP